MKKSIPGGRQNERDGTDAMTGETGLTAALADQSFTPSFGMTVTPLTGSTKLLGKGAPP